MTWLEHAAQIYAITAYVGIGIITGGIWSILFYSLWKNGK